MSRQIQSLLNAVQFMTLVPTPRTAQFDDDWLLSASKYFPLVGAGIGLVCGGVLLAGSLIWSGVVPAMMAVAAGAALTGALHEDGIADTADGLFGGSTREQRLALIKDSRLGLYGAVALVLSFAIRVAALASLPPWLGVATLVAGYSLGRTGIVAAMSALPYAGDAATGKLSYPTRAIGTCRLVRSGCVQRARGDVAGHAQSASGDCGAAGRGCVRLGGAVDRAPADRRLSRRRAWRH